MRLWDRLIPSRTPVVSPETHALREVMTEARLARGLAERTITRHADRSPADYVWRARPWPGGPHDEDSTSRS